MTASRDVAIKALANRISRDYPVRTLARNADVRTVMHTVSATVRYLFDLKAEIRTFLTVLSRGYPGISAANSINSEREFDHRLEACRADLSVKRILELPPESIVPSVQEQFRAPAHALARFVLAALSDWAESGVCGKLEMLGDGTVASSEFYRPYGPDGIEDIEVGSIINRQAPPSLWRHSYEWAIDREVRHVRSVPLMSHPAARRLLKSLPVCLCDDTRIYVGTQLTWYVESLEAESADSHTVDAHPDQILCVSFFDFILYQSTTRDVRLRQARQEQTRTVLQTWRDHVAPVLGGLALLIGAGLVALACWQEFGVPPTPDRSADKNLPAAESPAPATENHTSTPAARESDTRAAEMPAEVDIDATVDRMLTELRDIHGQE